MNTLYYGDNLDVLRRYIKDETVDLVYLDPPFNSNATYNVLFAEQDGTRAAAQIRAFEDTWRWDQEAEREYQETVEAGGKVADALIAFRTLLGESNMTAYLAMMAPRLVELRRVLKPTGSIYLHCDPTASHYLKLLMDAVFGPQYFRADITWQRTNTHSDAKRWSPVADTILYYGKSDRVTWHPAHAPHSDEYLRTKYRHQDPDGRRFQLDNMTSPHPRPNMTYEWKGHQPPAMGWRYSKETMAKLDAEGRIWYPDSTDKRPRLKRYLDEMPGVLLGNVWTDISPINSMAQERLGYPTQKPEALLERIIDASSNEGDVVLDPFCGCGTAISASQKLGRRWIGIDITHLAINLIKFRLLDEHKIEAGKDYQVIGEPTDLAGAQQLAQDDPFQFQSWALGLVGARVTEQKKGADKGIDGRIRFFDEAAPKPKQVILSVKAGHTSVPHVRDLRGVLDREKAEIGILITMQEPTQPMKTEAASAGFYQIEGFPEMYPRLQIRTIRELLEGKGIDMPSRHANVTFKKAPRAAANPGTILELPLHLGMNE
jgi:DNA modification methylase